MDFRNSQILISSTSRAIKTAKAVGRFNYTPIYIFKLYDYYKDFTQSLIDKGSTLYTSSNKLLKDEIENLIYKYPNNLCNYKVTTGDTLVNVTLPNIQNTAPVISGITVSLLTNTSYTFKKSDFTTVYTDVNNNPPKYIKLFINGLSGSIKYKGNIISNELQILLDDIIYVQYIRPNNSVLNTTLNFKISDDNINSLFSNSATITITGTEISTNQPPTITNVSVYADNRVTTIITLAMFTSGLTPPYNDPEGDLIDAIRIDSISNTNNGIFYNNGIPITVGLIILREDIVANLFTHVGADIDTISSDFFNFSVRDEGSQIWVS